VAKVLIAEDEKDIRELIAITLKLSGHTVITANNGEEAVKAAVQELPDIILMDLRMPRMNGSEAARKIKKTQGLSQIPIVFLTARDQDPEITGLIASGVEFINKPFSIEQLTRRVNEILARKA
jgi:two-component system, OmpR family, alkaline phosphatase synthesis response regulator PhoP